VYRGRVGTGWTVAEAAELQGALDARARASSPFDAVPRAIARDARWIAPELVGEIAFTELTPDGHLRHPAFMGLRRDKEAEEVTLEIPAAPLTDAQGVAAAARLGVRLTHPGRVVYPGQGVTKALLVAYYEAVAGRMLPHIVRRPLSLVRCPQGRAQARFFQKHDSGGFPPDFHKVPIAEKDGEVEDYMYVEDLAGLAAGVQMNTLEYHIWGSHVDDIERPDRLIFDIDPDEGLAFSHTREAALDFHDRLAALGLKTFALVTGGKGVHVVAPLAPRLAWSEVKSFCRGFAEKVAAEAPDRFTANIRKASRKGRMFVDYLRNERGATAIAPFSTRAREGAPCAVPVSWEELVTLDRANAFSLDEAAARARAPDPWAGYFDLRQTLTKAMLKAVA
jgi:bifunctional non-homologous end joining protein LigD